MANNGKKGTPYANFVDGVQALSRGERPENLSRTIDKAHTLLYGGFNPSYLPDSDWGAQVVRDFTKYCVSLGERRKIDIGGEKRMITTEDVAFDSLGAALRLTQDFVLPFNVGVERHSSFVDRVMKDISELGLSYVDSAVSAVSDGYVSGIEAPILKHYAIDLAKAGMRTRGVTRRELGTLVGDARRVFEKSPKDFLRPFENVTTDRKHIYKKIPLTREVIEKVLFCSDLRKKPYVPDMIVPIAHGGTELGIEIALEYERRGLEVPFVYPLFFSMKTRRQESPWTRNDHTFFGNIVGRNLLVTDDWITTGKTLKGILSQLEEQSPSEVRVAALKRDSEKSDTSFLEEDNLFLGREAVYPGEKGN